MTKYQWYPEDCSWFVCSVNLRWLNCMEYFFSFVSFLSTRLWYWWSLRSSCTYFVFILCICMCIGLQTNMIVDYQWPFSLFVYFGTTFTLIPCEKEGWVKDFSCCLRVIRAWCRNMLCCRIKLRDIIVAKKDVWENKQTNMIEYDSCHDDMMTIIQDYNYFTF